MATYTRFRCGLTAMPDGKAPTAIGLPTTSSVIVSITDTVASPELVT